MYFYLTVYVPDSVVEQVEEMSKNVSPSQALRLTSDIQLRKKYETALADGCLEEAALCKKVMNEREHLEKLRLEFEKKNGTNFVSKKP